MASFSRESATVGDAGVRGWESGTTLAVGSKHGVGAGNGRTGTRYCWKAVRRPGQEASGNGCRLVGVNRMTTEHPTKGEQRADAVPVVATAAVATESGGVCGDGGVPPASSPPTVISLAVPDGSPPSNGWVAAEGGAREEGKGTAATVTKMPKTEHDANGRRNDAVATTVPTEELANGSVADAAINRTRSPAHATPARRSSRLTEPSTRELAGATTSAYNKATLAAPTPLSSNGRHGVNATNGVAAISPEGSDASISRSKRALRRRSTAGPATSPGITPWKKTPTSSNNRAGAGKGPAITKAGSPGESRHDAIAVVTTAAAAAQTPTLLGIAPSRRCHKKKNPLELVSSSGPLGKAVSVSNKDAEGMSTGVAQPADGDDGDNNNDDDDDSPRTSRRKSRSQGVHDITLSAEERSTVAPTAGGMVAGRISGRQNDDGRGGVTDSSKSTGSALARVSAMAGSAEGQRSGCAENPAEASVSGVVGRAEVTTPSERDRNASSCSCAIVKSPTPQAWSSGINGQKFLAAQGGVSGDRDGGRGAGLTDDVSLRLAAMTEALRLMERIAILPALRRVAVAAQAEVDLSAENKAKNIAAIRIERVSDRFNLRGNSRENSRYEQTTTYLSLGCSIRDVFFLVRGYHSGGARALPFLTAGLGSLG